MPVELGHMVFSVAEPRCRCGLGCVEACTSLPPLAGSLGVPEPEVPRCGIEWVNTLTLSSRVRQDLRLRLFRLGLAIGNSLNVKPCPAVAINGWPLLLSEDERKALVDGIDSCLLGGLKSAQLSLAFVSPSTGNERRAGLRSLLPGLPRRHAGRSDGGG
jgi:hypothetical protein